MSKDRGNDASAQQSMSRRGLLKTAGIAGASAFLVGGLRCKLSHKGTLGIRYVKE